METNFNVDVKGHVLIKNTDTNEIILDKHNAIHPQNMARIIARALSHEPNSSIYRLALGNGGARFVTGEVIINDPIDGTDGSSWESRLYNETYSEIVDGTNALVGTDPGSSDASGIRIGGGADPSNDPSPDSVVSSEVGTKSNVVVTMYLNENEPSGQSDDITEDESTAETFFDFNELGLYSFGAPAVNSSGYSTVNVGTRTSDDISLLVVNSQYTLNISVDGTNYTTTIQTPGSGNGANGSITYGDICEGINTGSWIVSGDSIDDHVYVYITDNSDGTYPTILAAQSFGLLTFESRTAGAASSVNLTCTSGNANDFFNVIVNGVCGFVNFNTVSGKDAGVANDAITPTNERERLLTHLTFSTLRKSSLQSWVIQYTLTVSVAATTSSSVTL